MGKIILAVAVACFALLTGFAALAQSSYESRGYGGPLGVGPNFRHNQPSAQEYKPRRRTYKRRTTKRHKSTTSKKTDAAKTAEPAKKETASAKYESENSSITTETGDATVSAQAETERQEPAVAPAKPSGCKRYVAAVGKTISVPCD